MYVLCRKIFPLTLSACDAKVSRDLRDTPSSAASATVAMFDLMIFLVLALSVFSISTALKCSKMSRRRGIKNS